MVKPYDHIGTPDAFIAHIKSTRSEHDAALLASAFKLIPDKDPLFLEKGLAIADILLALGLDSDTLTIALLYPTYQAQEITREMISELLLTDDGSKLMRDVSRMKSLHKLQKPSQYNAQQSENLRKLLLAMVSDVRAVLIILAERLWQLRHAKELEDKLQLRLAKETLDIYAPLANRLGVWQLKWEMEDLCLRYLKPSVYSDIASGLASRRQEREEHITGLISTLNALLKQAHIKHFSVTGRVKHIYSIHNKMQRKNISLDKIYDAGALRVLVPEIEDCYTILGLIQNKWDQVSQEFDDYIANPKPNGYRSIHLVILDQYNKPVEIQIRTHKMHEESELGVAAHWRYKEGILQTSHYEAKIALLRQIMAWQKEIAVDERPTEKLTDLFADRVYVFTPQGDVIDLAQSATPLDFAYHIHSEVGHRCRGAKINSHIVPLTYTLKTGDRVEILTAREANPSRDWVNPQLGYLKTARARAKVMHWFKIHDSTYNAAEGRDILEREMKRLRIQEKPDLEKIAVKLNYKTSEDLLAALAMSDIGVAAITSQMQKPTTVTPTYTIAREQKNEPTNQIKILGVNNLLTQIARCCNPLPGDEIIGYITRTRGISIHRQRCDNILHASKSNENRLISVSWGDKYAENYPVDLIIKTLDKPGLLRDLTGILANEKINVIGLRTQKNKSTTEVDIHLSIEIASAERLNRTIDLLKQLPEVIQVIRR